MAGKFRNSTGRNKARHPNSLRIKEGGGGSREEEGLKWRHFAKIRKIKRIAGEGK